MATASEASDKDNADEKNSAEDSSTQVPRSGSTKIKLNELKLVDLKSQLENRDLDKTGVKSVLIERLKNALIDEGKNPEEYAFDIPTDSVSTSSSKTDKEKNSSSETNGSADLVLDEEHAGENNNDAEETNDNIDNTELKSDDIDNTELKMDDIDDAEQKSDVNDEALQLSVDDEEAQFNEEENSMDIACKISDNEITAVKVSTDNLEPSSSELTADEEVSEPISESLKENEESTVGKVAKSTNETQNELKDKKMSKSSGQSKNTTSVSTDSSATSPKVLKVAGKNDKVKHVALAAKSLCVTGLANSTRAADLKALFSKQGRVLSVKIVKSAKQTPGKCYGFVTMANSKDASKAIQNLHRTELNSRIISVERTQNDSNTLLKKPDSKLAILGAKKQALKSEAKSTTVAKTAAENKTSSSVPEIKETTKQDDKAAEATKTGDKVDGHKEDKGEGTEKSKVKEKERKPRESRDRKDNRHQTVRKPLNSRSRPFAFNDRSRLGNLRHHFGRKPYFNRPSFKPSISSSSVRPKSNLLTFQKIREERLRQREHFRERERREDERRRAAEMYRHKFIERKQREESYRLEREKEKLRLEREILERERSEILKLEREKHRLERERLEREREELRQQAELRRGGKRPFSRIDRDPEPFWDDRKRSAPRYEGRTSFHTDVASSSRYDFPHRERPNYSRHGHELDSRPERFQKSIEIAPRSDFSGRDTRREVTIRSRDERQVYDRSEFRDRDSRRSFPSRERERHSSSRREPPRDDWKHVRRVHERMVAPNSSSGQRRMTYY